MPNSLRAETRKKNNEKLGATPNQRIKRRESGFSRRLVPEISKKLRIQGQPRATEWNSEKVDLVGEKTVELHQKPLQEAKQVDRNVPSPENVRPC